MLLRYVRDIYQFENSKKNNLKNLFHLYKNLNDPKDIMFNLINTIFFGTINFLTCKIYILLFFPTANSISRLIYFVNFII